MKLDTVAILRILDTAEQTIPARELSQFQSLSQPLRAFAQRWSKGAIGVNRDGLVELLRRFLAVEGHFGGSGKERRFDDVLFELRQGRCVPHAIASVVAAAAVVVVVVVVLCVCGACLCLHVCICVCGCLSVA